MGCVRSTEFIVENPRTIREDVRFEDVVDIRSNCYPQIISNLANQTSAIIRKV